MSWSFNAVGRPAAVLEKARKDLNGHPCPEPEQTVKGQVLQVLEAALPVYPATFAVKVIACGSQYAPDHQKPEEAVNTLHLEIQPIHGFVE